jgi:glucose-1-phosphate adenylyltransferase
VPFGGRYRIIDFVLSNLINSGIFSIYVLTQFKSQSLLQHLREGWEVSGLLKNNFIIPVPAQMRSAQEDWYRGTADAIHQNINLIQQADPHVVVIFGADHIYRMNIRQMIEYHVEKRAGVTIAAIPGTKRTRVRVRRHRNHRRRQHHRGFPREAIPTRPPCPATLIACTPPWATTFSLPMCCCANSWRTATAKTVRTISAKTFCLRLIGRADMYAYDFQTNIIPGDPIGSPQYWRDVGTLDAYYEASMDLRAVSPELNLYNRQWPLRTAGYFDAPAKFVFDEEGRRGMAIDTIIAGSSIVSGGKVTGSVLGRGVRVHTGVSVIDSVIFDNCDIGRHAKVKRAILDKNVKIPPGTEIGYNLDEDRKKYHVTESGIVVIEGHHTTVDIATIQV